MATAQQIASAGVYATDDIGLEITDGTLSRVQLGLLPSGDYGLRIVGQNGVVGVIIDGTSDMFRISATGTQTTGVVATNNVGSVSVTLAALGTYTSSPASILLQAFSNAASGLQSPSLWTTTTVLAFVAATSGGAVTLPMWLMENMAAGDVRLSASQVVVELSAWNTTGGNLTAYQRYYVLQQTGI